LPVPLVTSDEGVVTGDERAEALADHVRQPLRRLAQRQHDGWAIGGVDTGLESLDPALARWIGVEIEPREVGELPAPLLLAGQRELRRERGALAAPLRKPIRLSDRGRRR
jgi:hypothetical protein